MIIELLMNLLKSLIMLVISLFPTIPPMTSIVQSLQPIAEVMIKINSFVSISLFANCVLALIAFSNLELIWAIVMWCVKKIPGVS